jgi:TonB family protein
MHKIILLTLSLFPAILLGQATKKVTDKDKHEVYYVLKSNKTIRQGNYKKSGWKGKPLIDGYYKNGSKDSIWTFFDDGQVEQKYDYTKRELVYEKTDTSKTNHKCKILKGADTIEIKLDHPPVYIGGGNVLGQFLADNVEYPESAKDANKQGTVQISFVIDKKGYSSNFKVAKSVCPALDQESLRVAKVLPNEWIPGVLNGEKVDVIYTLPVRFVLR